jgi:hypothetical protein
VDELVVGVQLLEANLYTRLRADRRPPAAGQSARQ